MKDPRDIQGQLRGCSRRQFLSSAMAMALLPLARPSLIDACNLPPSPTGACVPNSWLDGGRLDVEGYTDQRSYLPGERVTLFMSSQARTRATVVIHRLGVHQDLVWSAPVWVQPTRSQLTRLNMGADGNMERAARYRLRCRPHGRLDFIESR